MSAQNPYAPPKASVEAPAGAVDIDSLQVSESWKRKFRAMQKAGGPNLPNMKDLSAEEKKDLSPFNIVAFLFGPFYYLAKGMWRKAIVLSILGFIGILIIDLIMVLVGLGNYTRVTGFVMAAVFAALANRDYYCRVVLRQNGWWWSSKG